MKQVKFTMLLAEPKRDALLRIIGRLHDAMRSNDNWLPIGNLDRLDESAVYEMYRALQRTKADQLGGVR